MSTLLLILGIILLVVVVYAVSILIQAAVLQSLWGWFIVPTFALPELTIHVAIGMILVAWALGVRPPQYNDSDNENVPNWVPAAVLLFGAPLFVYLFGAIVHSMML